MIKAPLDCSAEEKRNFIEMVIKGSQVCQKTLPSLVEQAKFLAFYKEANELVGVGGIKKPEDSYRDKVFRKAKLSDEIARQYEIELGWIFVEKEFWRQHIGTTIVRELLGKVKGDKVYATTRSDNEPMKCILRSFNFHESGKEYKSTRHKQSVVLFVRER